MGIKGVLVIKREFDELKARLGKEEKRLKKGGSAGVSYTVDRNDRRAAVVLTTSEF